MRDEISVALAILEQAMNLEEEGRTFYLKVAQTTREEKGQEIFRTLAADEQSHFNLLKKQHQALTSRKKWIMSAEIKPIKLDLNQSLFPKSKEAQKAITTKAGDRDALSFGLDIETKSYDFYRKAASETADPLGKSTFEFLAGEEKRHFDILMMRFDFLFGPIAWTS
ncbi:MAG: ferritin family protein [Chloroflexi bacterium]|nr:ferritin family protein [Chloroflexota bacterium]